MKKKISLISGVNGQDGSFLTELLLEKQYKVYGIVRRSSTDNHLDRIQHLLNNSDFELITCDVCDFSGINRLINQLRPDEIYNTAAQSHVQVSFSEPLVTLDINAKAPINMLESIRQHSRNTKFLQCSSSELFGNSEEFPQNEKTRFNPQSPYAIAKLAAHDVVRIYRDGYKLFCCASICFNHESNRRSEQFVTRKITKYVAKVKKFMNLNNGDLPDPSLDEIDYLLMGNLDSCRDWSHAKDMVNGMYLMLQQDKPKDYVLASGQTHTIKELLQLAFSYIGISNYMQFVKIDPKFYRPCEVNLLLGDSSLARQELGWSPEHTFEQLIQEMVQYDIKEEIGCG